MSQNKLLSKLFLTFKEITFSKSKFLIGILVLYTWDKHLEIQNKNLYYLFND